MLFGVEGLQVTDARGRGRTARWRYGRSLIIRPRRRARTAGRSRGGVHETVLARPRDVRRGRRPGARCAWVKRRWKCDEPGCARKTFTEWVPQVPPRCRLTRPAAGAGRARRSPSGGSRRRRRPGTPGCPGRWRMTRSLPRRTRCWSRPRRLVAHLGIDEHRRGRPRWRIDEQTGEYLLLADRWHTCFFDLSGDQGLLGQVEGRTADDAAYWLAQAAPAWRDAVRVVAIDMCSIYASAVRRMLPGAQIAVDLFHVVHLAVKMTGDVRRRVVRGKYGRRGRSGDPEYGIKNLLVRNLEHLSPAQFAKVTGTLRRRPGRAGDRRRLDRQGKTPPRAEPARPRHRLRPVRAQCPGPAVRLLRLVRPQRRHPRAAQPGQDDLPVGRPDRLRGPDRRHERHLRKPEPARQARSPPGIRLPQPGKPAQARPHRLHPRPTAPITHRNRRRTRSGNRAETRSRLTSKSHHMPSSTALGVFPERSLAARPGWRT